AMPACDLAHDGEPHAESARGAVAAAVQAHEGLEEPLAVLRGHPGAVVIDMDHGAAGLGGHPYAHAGACVLDGVAHQVGHGAAHVARLAPQLVHADVGLHARAT